MDRDSIDASDGDKPLKLYRLILEYTRDMLPHLLAEAEKEKPYRVIFDSLALWGRAVGEIMKIPSYSFYSIAVVDRVGGNAFWGICIRVLSFLFSGMRENLIGPWMSAAS